MISQTPWFEREFDFNFPVGLFPVILERLRDTLPCIKALVENCSEEILRQKISGNWSPKEQVGHLYDLEELWYGRLQDFLDGRQMLRAADLRNTKTHEANHNQEKMDQLIEKFSSARSRLIGKASDMDEATASRTALHPRLQKPMRLIDSLFFVAEHDDHHLAKIRELLLRR